jgi:DNA-binding transcriptional LysR family regulator
MMLEPDKFEPARATTTFRVAVDNYAAIVLVAPIAVHVARVAPGVRLDFRPSGTLDVLGQLDRSELHLAIGPSAVQGERFSGRRLLQDEFVVVHRKGHPAIRTQELSTDKLSSLDAGPVPVSCSDLGNVGLGGCASAERREEHDKIPSAWLPSAITFAQADRSRNDLAETARQSACARVAARCY